MGNLPYQLVSRISSINRIRNHSFPCFPRRNQGLHRLKGWPVGSPFIFQGTVGSTVFSAAMLWISKADTTDPTGGGGGATSKYLTPGSPKDFVKMTAMISIIFVFKRIWRSWGFLLAFFWGDTKTNICSYWWAVSAMCLVVLFTVRLTQQLQPVQPCGLESKDVSKEFSELKDLHHDTEWVE